jgi:hypothetical protein
MVRILNHAHGPGTVTLLLMMEIPMGTGEIVECGVCWTGRDEAHKQAQRKGIAED